MMKFGKRLIEINTGKEVSDERRNVIQHTGRIGFQVIRETSGREINKGFVSAFEYCSLGYLYVVTNNKFKYNKKTKERTLERKKRKRISKDE